MVTVNHLLSFGVSPQYYIAVHGATALTSRYFQVFIFSFDDAAAIIVLKDLFLVSCIYSYFQYWYYYLIFLNLELSVIFLHSVVQICSNDMKFPLVFFVSVLKLVYVIMLTKPKSLPLNAQPNIKGLKSNLHPKNGTTIANDVAVKQLGFWLHLASTSIPDGVEKVCKSITRSPKISVA